MELIFLSIGSYTNVNDFLCHISDLVQIRLDIGETYNTLFDKLECKFTSDERKLIAITDWINFNKDSHDDKSIFDTVICDEENLFAIFDLINKK
jgi:hypothetical protein